MPPDPAGRHRRTWPLRASIANTGVCPASSAQASRYLPSSDHCGSVGQRSQSAAHGARAPLATSISSSVGRGACCGDRTLRTTDSVRPSGEKRGHWQLASAPDPTTRAAALSASINHTSVSSHRSAPGLARVIAISLPSDATSKSGSMANWRRACGVRSIRAPIGAPGAA